MHSYTASYLPLIPLLPLIGFLINGLFGKHLDKRVVAGIGFGSVGASFILSVITFANLSGEHGAAISHVYNWISIGGLDLSFGFLVDNLAGVMLMVVTGVGLLIHIYSVGYMSEDPGFSRFFAYMNLFTFSMLVLVMADNLLLLFVGWEGVGLCSYLLIGFWFTDADKPKAGQKAFIANRIGDLAFLIGLFMLAGIVGTLDIDTLNQAAAATQHVAADAAAHGAEDVGQAVAETGGEQMSWLYSYAWVICLFLFIGACGKSAQIPLYVWLPDAMAGPTPVSALIHAATMVTAGVFMIVRLGALFALSPFAGSIIAIVGGATALFAALIALSQTDIKKVLAYSTVSQLGYMFMAAGAGTIYYGAYVAAVFHLVTHAFFKALLFMGAGSVIHGMHHAYPDKGEDFVQDMRNMGGLHRKMPITSWTFLAGAAALAGLVPFAGFWSKDEILHGLWNVSFAGAEGLPVIFFAIALLFGLVAALLTAFYTARAVILTFFGEHKGTAEGYAHVHESPSVMWMPLVILGVLSCVGGAVNLSGAGEPIGDGLKHFLAYDKDSSVLANTVDTGHGHGHGHGDHGDHAGHAEAHVEYDYTEEPGANIWNGLFGSLDMVGLVLMIVSTAIAGFGVFVAWRFYMKDHERHAARFKEGSQLEKLRIASYNRFWVDEFYEKWILTPIYNTAAILFIVIDRLLIDLSVFLTGQFVLFVSSGARRIQTGLLSLYAVSFVLGVLLVLGILFFQVIGLLFIG